MSVVLVQIQKPHVRQTGSGINFHRCSCETIALMSNISRLYNSDRYHGGVNEIQNHLCATDWQHDF